jgi:protein-tyrosine-phosphatase
MRVEEEGLEGSYEADSAGTGAWHVGDPPDQRAIAVASRHGIRLRGPARQIRRDDASEFDLILAMDRSNLRGVVDVLPEDGADVRPNERAALDRIREDGRARSYQTNPATMTAVPITSTMWTGTQRPVVAASGTVVTPQPRRRRSRVGRRRSSPHRHRG